MASESLKANKNIWIRFDRDDYESDAWESLCRGMQIDPDTKSFIAEVDRTSVRKDQYSEDGDLLTTNWPDVSHCLTRDPEAAMSITIKKRRGRPVAARQSFEIWNHAFTYLIDNIIRILKERAPEELPAPDGTWLANAHSLEETLLGPTVTCAIPRIKLLERLRELRRKEIQNLKSRSKDASQTLADVIGSTAKLLEQLIRLYSSNNSRIIDAARKMHYSTVDEAGGSCEQQIAAARDTLQRSSADTPDQTTSTVLSYRIVEQVPAETLKQLLNNAGLTIEILDAPTGAGSSYSTKIEWLGNQTSVTQVMPRIAIVKNIEKTTAAG